MNVQIPIAGLTLSDGQTYNGQLPVWATRPLMVKVTPDFISGNEYPVYVRVTNGGAIKKEITLPYQEVVNLDLSFAAPLLTRADRNKSEGDPAFPQQEVAIWSSNIANKITLPVFHCDETYWDTLGVDSALPQPPKPRIPNQTLDIYFPYRIHPLDAFQVEVEPVTGAPSDVIFPTTYVLGNTIDIKYIKKLTIKNVWGSGLDQVINYEDRLMSDAIYDESLQCALRARWNMRNGQWFWAAFKDYFWSNKFTPIRGRGGVTEQAELTINLEYGEEWYNVYQELLVSSNVVFDLSLPGINQYQNKRFRAEVMGDTGARWSNSTRTYRQQVRFRTTELQDNYMFPLAPDQPPTPSIAFSAQHNPWTIGAEYAEGLVNSIYSNAAWDVQSVPSWFAPGDKIPLTPADFVQGGFIYEAGAYWEDLPAPTHPQVIRTTKPIPTRGRNINLISLKRGYNYDIVLLDADGKAFHQASKYTDAGGMWLITGAESFVLSIRKLNASETALTPITPSDMETAGTSVQDANKLFDYPAGASNLTATVAANTGEARTGNIVLKSKAGSTTYNIVVTQAGVSGNISVDTSTFSLDYITLPVTVNVTSVGAWSVSQRDVWITPDVSEGAPGKTTVTLTIGDNVASGASARTGTITFYNDQTEEIAVVTVNQGGAPTSITIAPTRVTGAKAASPTPLIAVAVSQNNWVMGSAPSWVAISPQSGENGQTVIGVTFNSTNTTGAKRSGYLRLENTTTNEIAICIIEQEG
nr:MAG TPA: hypothetical protein [Caudoviricetes sp.]